MKNSKKIIYSIIFLFVIFSANFVYAEENANIYKSSEKQEKGNVTYAQEVTQDMASATYWSNKLGQDANKLMLNSDEISKINKEIINESETLVCDITKVAEDKTQAERKSSLVSAIDDEFNYMVRKYPDKDRKLYVDGKLIDNIPYIENLKNAVLTTGFENDEEKVQIYAVAVKRTEIKMFPTNSIWGYDSADDPDDESCYTTLEVNEPFVIRAKCIVGQDTFYWGLSNSYTGWVDAKYLALFDSKQDWINAWKVDIKGKDFLIVTQDNITLEPSITSPKTSEVELKIGTVLKLVPQNEIPESVNERKTWNNYVVYLPTRNEEGKYVRSYALISEHYQVSIGYLALTQKNILEVAFTCLGNRYGWGGMLGAMDCSAYTKAIYKCFGLDIPRDSSVQEKVPNRVVSLEDMSDEEKEAYIEKLPIGTPLYFSGHVMVYVGSENGKNYVISDTGSLSDSYGDINVRSMYSVILNPLTVRRRNETTWLNSLRSALVFGQLPDDKEKAENKDVYVTIDEENQKGNITYSDGISSNMSKASYWKELLSEQNKQLLSKDGIQELNTEINGKSNNDINSKSILVVTQDRIILEPSISQPEISKVELPLGTVLELVPEDKIPTNLAERGTWNNYVVYLPVKNSNGEVEKRFALIPEHYSVSTGYLDFTPKNIIDVAFRSLGDSNELIDNTTFINSIYKCFGLELNIDENFNTKLKDKIKDVSNMTLDEKRKCFESLTVGSILKIKDEYSIYLGNQGNNQYTILSTDGNINSIVINKLVLDNLNAIIDFKQKQEDGTAVNPLIEKEDKKNIQYEVIEGKEQIIEYGNDTKTDSNIISTKNPKTGDDIIMWICLMIISILGIAGTVKFAKKNIKCRRNNDEKY